MKTVDQKVANGGYSLVSYFAKGIAEPGKPEFQVVYEDKIYYFASAEQMAVFEAAPEAFLPIFGEECAFGHSIEKEFPTDPTNFKIVDGELLLFLKNSEIDAKVLWEKEGDSVCMVKAKNHFHATNADIA